MTPCYLDCNATTPVDPRVQQAVLRYLGEEFGNAASPHMLGSRAKRAVERAREQVAAVVRARRHEVVFTSGATESNNLAILGLAAHGERVGKRHIVSTQIEHKAVLEPLESLARRGFEITLVPPDRGGRVSATDVLDAVRDDTLLVSVMHVNNETGVRQPIEEIAEGLIGRSQATGLTNANRQADVSPVACDRSLDSRLRGNDGFDSRAGASWLYERSIYFHVDAAQGFGKDLIPLAHPGIDLISVSSHKIYGPQGVGALIARRRRHELPPLAPLMYGGGHEFGLRPGTLPVALIVGLGLAAELAVAEAEDRAAKCRAFRERLLASLSPLRPIVHGDPAWTLPHVLYASIPGIDSDEAIEALAPHAAVSNGSACTSICPTSSHVLSAMGVDPATSQSAIRFSWCHTTSVADFTPLVRTLVALQRSTPLTTDH